MEKFTQKELIKTLHEGGNFDHVTSEVVLLEDTVWELANGAYRSLGELQIPLQYFNGEYDDDEHYIAYGLLTVLSHDFFEGIIPRKKSGEPLYIDDHINVVRGARKFIHSCGYSDKGGSARKIVEEFVADFFKLYKNRTSETDETRECLERSFIKYTSS
ncbi:hypothetical protein HZA96_04340 [Candidatus Woesearchaeota archaeon]|nr:hypothetical protein [Candidatus Woesearchaeota archaeon]